MHLQANQTEVTYTYVRALFFSWCFRAELVRKAQGEYFAEEVQIQRPITSSRYSSLQESNVTIPFLSTNVDYHWNYAVN